MSRLASQAVAGFFPTPPRVVEGILGQLAKEESGARRMIRVLDPCAGTGEPVARIASALGAESYGIKINAERAKRCQTHLNHVLATSAFSVRLANGAFSLLWLNATYDQDDAKRRLEHAFLTSLTRALAPRGVLVYLIPHRRLAISARYLAAHCTGFRAYRFPDPEYGTFQQIVLLAVHKAQATLDTSVQVQLEAWTTSDLPPLHNVPSTAPIRVPALPRGEILFAPIAFDPALAAREAQRRGVWTRATFAQHIWPPEEGAVRPLMPLRRGHLALLIAAGLRNDVVLRQGERRALVKGRTRKEKIAVESDDEDTEVQREVLRASVVVLDLETCAIDCIDREGGGDPMGDQSALTLPSLPGEVIGGRRTVGRPLMVQGWPIPHQYGEVPLSTNNQYSG